MSVFQVALLIVIAALAIALALWARTDRARSRDVVVWGALLLAAAAAILWPDFTTTVARAIGIQRGADLILYCAVVFLTTGMAVLYLRVRQMRREITLLTRHIAIQNPLGKGAPVGGADGITRRSRTDPAADR